MFRLFELKRYKEVEDRKPPTPFYQTPVSLPHGFLEILWACVRIMCHPASIWLKLGDNSFSVLKCLPFLFAAVKYSIVHGQPPGLFSAIPYYRRGFVGTPLARRLSSEASSSQFSIRPPWGGCHEEGAFPGDTRTPEDLCMSTNPRL